jgi:catalase
MAYRSAPDPVYAPNSFGGPSAEPKFAEPSWQSSGELVRAAYSKHRDDDDFGQAGTLYRDVLDDAAKARLVTNISNHLSNGVEGDVLERAFEYWRSVDADLGARVAKALSAG